MSDKSEACPMCGMPVGMDVEEYNKLLEAEKTTPQQQDNNELPITTPNEGEAPLGNAIIPLPAPQEPKKKSKMGLVIGVVAGILAIAAIAGFFFMKGHEAEKTSEEQIATQNETQLIEEKTLETLDRATDPCLTALNQLYNNYVFGNQFDQFELVVNDLFTMKGKQKLLDAYDYECETGDCYGIWALRTMAQDGEGESKIIDITPLGNNKYTVKYLDMGSMGETMLVFAEEGGKMKIDDFRTIFDESYDENVGYMSKDNLPHVYANAYDGFVNIRQAPQSEAPILGVLRNGPEGAILLGAEGEWTQIDCNGIVGYVLSKYVQDTPTLAVDEGIDMSWLEGWWEDNECHSLLVFDNGGFMEYSCMFNEGSTTKKGTFILQGSSLALTVLVDFVNWPENQYTNTIALPLDPVKKTIIGYKKQQFKTKELHVYLEERGEEMYDDLYLTKKEFNNFKKHVFDKFTGY